MDHIKLWPISVCFAIALHCMASSVAQVLPADSVLPGSNNSIIFYRAGENGYYGNNVTVRATSLPDSANKSWFDEETLLPGGTLRKFYLMAHNYGTLDDASTRIRLQIWRPVDIINYRLMLVWQQVVQVAVPAQAPLLYTYTINQAVALVAGDRIGWAFEGKAGPISFEYTESHRTRLQSPKFSGLPQVGQTIDFDPVYLPSIFSVAVSVDGNSTSSAVITVVPLKTTTAFLEDLQNSTQSLNNGTTGRSDNLVAGVITLVALLGLCILQ